ncbi:hypothetical protein [Microcoleus sp.]|uniref:hypothetical protein n=1 Tax=Microcoleus sp. TaxID=44472 RepID=UPI00403E7FBA
MSGRPHIKITESVEDLREILKQQKRTLAHYSQVKLKALLSMSNFTHILPVDPIKI